jgi:alkylation response protein AidB-like acyl-CoA dehydrogenase
MFDFALNDDEKMLDEMIERLLETPDPDGRWGSLAELGLLAMGFSPEQGGSGMGAVGAYLLGRHFGRAGEQSPWLASIVGAAPLLADSQALPDILAGRIRPALAIAEAGRSWDGQDPTTRADRDGDAYRLTGRKQLVLDAEDADLFVVSAAFDGGVALFTVDRAAADVAGHALLDGGRAAAVTFDATPATMLAGPNEAPALLGQTVDQVGAALVAEAAGLAERLVRLTREHVTTRVQFGAPLSRNQVLQHRLVDMWIESELIRAAAGAAAMSVDGHGPAERRRHVSAARVAAAKGGRFVAEQAIQLHGAMGMTDESLTAYPVRRLTTIAKLFGDQRDHLDSFIAG